MKRNTAGDPVVHRWFNAPPSCRACRSKKRKCDRRSPCSNCAQRNLTCEYEDGTAIQTSIQLSGRSAAQSPSKHSPVSRVNKGSDEEAFDANSVLERLSTLENAVFNKQGLSPVNGSALKSSQDGYTPFHMHAKHSTREPALHASSLVYHLPPVDEARILFKHFTKTLQPTMMLLNLKYANEILDHIYGMSKEPSDAEIPNVLLLLCIVAGSALMWTPELMKTLKCSQAEAQAASHEYLRVAVSIVDHPTALASTTTALVSMTLLANIILSFEGLVVKSHTIRARCHLMARDMQVHFLDREAGHEEGGVAKLNEVEKELQRRTWWNLVGTDWLSAFSDVSQEGVYSFHPKHMVVRYPRNADDHTLCTAAEPQDLPPSEPTDMSASIQRIRVADLCRAIADHMPWTMEPDEYTTILQLDQKFQELLESIPKFLKIDPESTRDSQHICDKRPYIAMQRLGLNFSIYTRRCRLHRAYHLKGILDPKYSYSRTTCVAAAHTVLQLRREMDESGKAAMFKPQRLWTVIQHTILATLVLATDVSLDPNSPHAKAQEAKVVAAYRTLERSKEESSNFRDTLQKSMQKIVAKLQPTSSSEGLIGDLQYGGSHLSTDQGTIAQSSSMPLGSHVAHNEENDHLHDLTTQLSTGQQDNPPIGVVPAKDWDPIWSEFLSLAPDFDASQWNMLFDEMDLPF